jgi:AraC family transcriptional regulator
MSIVARAIWHIESRLSNEITLDHVAAAAGVSRFHIDRAFSAATTLSVMRYVRARRLSEAAKALRAGAPSILTVALEARYGSHEAFTRAFVDQFGVTPRDVRSDACRQLALQEPITVDTGDGKACVPSRIVTMPSMQIVGLRQRYSFAARAGVPLTWERFAGHIGEIAGEVSGAAFGVVDEWTEDGGFHYLAGVEVTPTATTPAEFVRFSIPARLCAIFNHSGHISRIRETLRSIWNMWTPTVPYEIDDAPLIERYGPLFDPRSGDGGLEIWIPLRCRADASNSTPHSNIQEA